MISTRNTENARSKLKSEILYWKRDSPTERNSIHWWKRFQMQRKNIPHPDILSNRRKYTIRPKWDKQKLFTTLSFWSKIPLISSFKPCFHDHSRHNKASHRVQEAHAQHCSSWKAKSEKQKGHQISSFRRKFSSNSLILTSIENFLSFTNWNVISVVHSPNPKHQPSVAIISRGDIRLQTEE